MNKAKPQVKETVQQSEEQILALWQKNKIYAKSVKQNARGSKFYMMDGPPYANGHIHMGTALNKILKDIAMRAQRMQGKNVFDRPGYDTHGIPIEFHVEKEIGSKSKKDIETYGVQKFINRCKQFATQYIDSMSKEFSNLGVWMDWDNPYVTLYDEWIEASWAALKQAEAKKLLYLGKYPVHVCPRCETAVAFNEIEYGKQKDTSIYVKFKLVGKKNTYLVIWTTTPWTLPANTGVMVHPDVIYQEIETSEGEHWIIAKDLVGKIMQVLERGFTPKAEFKGKDMLGWKYESPLSKNLNLKVKNAYKVVTSARYVTTEDGTGLVHCAPGHGKEDYEVGKEFGLDMPSPVLSNGFLTEEAGKYAGKKAREVDREIIADLEKDNALIYKLEYEHDYPLCWRDAQPLLMISQPQWFIKVTEIKSALLKENDRVVWIPDWMKQRMHAWLDGLSDWPISRQRYWGTPMPIWRDEKSGELVVVGSIAELEKLSGQKIKDMHKPGIDEITIKTKAGNILRRVPEVLDVWFDSGVASWAALGYPRKSSEFKKFWPADLNIEGRDQFRGWWNSQMILSQILFDKKPFDSIVVHGMILDLGKRKMSKSKGNVVTPEEIIVSFGRDYMRYYFAKLSKGDDFVYDDSEFSEIQKVMTILLNVNNFVNQLQAEKSKPELEDKWILSKFNSLVRDVTELYNSYKLPEIVQKMEQFIVNDLSRGYIKMIRERSNEAASVLKEIRNGLLQLLAPIIPFTTEKIWMSLKEKKQVKSESVHLSEFPEANKKLVSPELEKSFEKAMQIIEIGLAARDAAKLGLKWPLAGATITAPDAISPALQEVIAKQLNIKSTKVQKGKELAVKLDTKMTPELESEGYARELSRLVQSARKKAGFVKTDVINLEVITDAKSLLETQKKFIQDRVNAKSLSFAPSKNKFNYSEKAKIKDKNFEIKFKKI